MRSNVIGQTSIVLPFGALPTDPATIIGSDIDATVSAYYLALGFTVTSTIIFRVDATTAGYIVQLGFSGASIVAMGSYRSITGVQELIRMTGNFGTLSPATLDLGLMGTQLSPVWASTAWQNPLVNIPLGTQFNIDGVSQPRGLCSIVDANTDTAAIGAEAIVMTLPAMTFYDTRCYEVRWSMRLDSSAAQVASARIRKTNLAGTQLLYSQYQRLALERTNEYYVGKIARDAGSDLTAVTLVLTLAANAGNVTGRGAADTTRWVEVWDIGQASQFPNAIRIT